MTDFTVLNRILPSGGNTIWTHPGGFASYHEARSDRFARFTPALAILLAIGGLLLILQGFVFPSLHTLGRAMVVQEVAGTKRARFDVHLRGSSTFRPLTPLKVYRTMCRSSIP